MLRISFKYSLDYTDKKEIPTSDKKEKAKPEKRYGGVIFEGDIILTADKEESKELMKIWKKKEAEIAQAKGATEAAAEAKGEAKK